MSGVVVRLLVLVVCVAAVGAAAAEGGSQEEPRATMDRVFEALAELLPLSFDERVFADPERRDQIHQKLDQLAESAHALEAHARGRDAGFRFRSRSLSNDITEIRRRYDYGRFAEAQFYVGQLTEHCVGCHARLPAARNFPLAENLLARPAIRKMEPRDLARLQVATRQFDRALEFWEGRLADPVVSPGELDLDGELVDYLTVCLRVKSDLPRARKTLAKLAQREDLPRYLRYLSNAWIESLGTLSDQRFEPSVARARELIARSHELTEFPADRAGLVYDLIASSVLYRRIDMPDVPDSELAEAFYLLGAIEARSSQSSWVPSAEFHLEAAIRMAPKAEFAEKAYALLEEYTVLSYGGSSGVNIPPDVEKKLAELRGLIDAKS